MQIHKAIATPKLTTLTLAIAAALAQMASMSVALAQTPSAPLPSGGSVVTGARAPQVNQQTMTIDQTAPRAIINWNSFNIAPGNTVKFNQQGNADWAVLNRVVGTERSLIQGALQADGQVYLLNRNGIVIGRGAQVNVHTFLASTLTITDQIFKDGLLSVARNSPALIAGTGAEAPTGGIRIEPDAIVVAKDGGRISFIASGTIYDRNGVPLLGPDGKPTGFVENAGQLLATNGQIILAAGDKVFFRAASAVTGTDPAEAGFAGLVVDVDNGGRVANAVGGLIQSRLGNVSMVGLLVNQDARLTATTSVQRNGSIWLLARDNQGARGGQLTLGSDSVTEAIPDKITDALRKTDADGAFSPSRVRLEGQSIHLRGSETRGARLYAPNAVVTATARLDSNITAVAQAPADSASILVDKNAIIDVAGLRGVPNDQGAIANQTGIAIPIERNSVRIELRGEQLADAPLLRDSPIRSQTIFIDSRLGTTLINQDTVAAAIKAQTERGVYERMATGGSISLSSTGATVLQLGSRINIAGGLLAYGSGVVRVSRLFDGRNFRSVTTAQSDRLYTSISDYSVRLQEAGYSEGKAAGSLDIVSRNLLLGSIITGGAVSGQYQKLTSPFRGSLRVGPSSDLSAVGDFGLFHGLVFADAHSNRLPSYFLTDQIDTAQLAEQFGSAGNPVNQTVSLSMLSTSNLGRISFSGNEGMRITPGTVLTFAPGTDLTLNSNASVQISRSVRSAAGRLNFASALPIVVDNGVSLDLSGLWLNDRAANPLLRNLTKGEALPELDAATGKPIVRALTHGGELRFADANVNIVFTGNVRAVFGSDTTVDTSSGAYIDAAAKIVGGRGGLLSAGFKSDDAVGNRDSVNLPTTLRGFGFGSGSALRLTDVAGTGQLWFGNNRPAQAQAYSTNLFTQFGYSDISLGSNQITFASGYNLELSLLQYQLPNSDIRLEGGALQAMARAEILPTTLAAPVRLAFNGGSATTGLVVQSGASITVPIGGSISLSSTGTTTVEGRLSARAGTVAITSAAAAQNAFNPTAGVRLIAGSSVDVSGVGVTRSVAGVDTFGEVRAGGTVILNAIAATGTGSVESGVVMVDANASINIGGASQRYAIANRVGFDTANVTTLLSSDAGSIQVLSAQGGVFAGSVSARGGSATNADGKIEFSFKSSTASNQFNPNPNPPYILYPLGERQFVIASADRVKPEGFALTGDYDIALNGARPISDFNDAASLLAFSRRVSRMAISDVSLAQVGSLFLSNGEVTQFDGASRLAASNQIAINTPNIRVAPNQAVQITAPHVKLGQGFTVSVAAAPAALNNGTINVTAPLGIDIDNALTIQAAQAVALRTRGDIRLHGNELNAVTGLASGVLTTAGNLTLEAAQIYPTTRSDFSVNALGKIITVVRPEGTTGPAPTPFSVDGRLTLNAAQIDQSGVVRAPLGQINLNGSSSVQLQAGSITSVSGAGLTMPLGELGNLVDWRVGVGGQFALTAPPKFITINSPVFTSQPESGGKPAALLDVSGGGDLVAAEFVKGPLGSADLLSVTSGRFALVPNYLAPLAPVGVSTGANFGETIRIDSSATAGSAGIPNGVYVVLPASYAQLPGAFLVRSIASSALGAALPGSGVKTAADGVQTVIGYRGREALGIAGQKAEWFEILNGQQLRSRAEYREATASGFFADTNAIIQTQDAGVLRLSIDRQLSIDAAVDMSGFVAPSNAQVSAGQRGRLEIVSDRLTITQADGAAIDDGSVRVSQATLARIAPREIILGGTLDSLTEPAKLSTAATSINFEAGVSVRAESVIATATQSINLGVGVVLNAAPSAIQNREADTQQRVLNVSSRSNGANSTGALLAASSDALVINRLGTVIGGSPQITLADSAQITGRSVIADSTGKLAVSASAIVAGSESTRVGVQTILLGNAPTTADGLRLSGALLDRIGGSANPSLTAYQQVRAFGPVTLGSDQTNTFTLDTPALIAGASGTLLTINAQQIVWNNNRAADSVVAAEASTLGSVLTLNATAARGAAFTIGAGNKRIGGFESSQVNVGSASAGSTLAMTGTGALTASGRVNVSVDSVQGAALSNQRITTASALVLDRRFARQVRDVAGPAGGRLALTGQSVVVDTGLAYLSGTVDVRASSGDLRIGSKADIDLSGASRALFDQRIELAGGRLNLTTDSASSQLAVDSGARIDVASRGNLGGTVDIAAAGQIALASGSQFKGQGAEQKLGGSFSVQARQGLDLDQVAATTTAGDFDRSISVRARTGALNLSAGSTLRAERVSISADDGSMTISGSIDARAVSGGFVELWQGSTTTGVLNLTANALIDVRGQTGGGDVTIGSTKGIIINGAPRVLTGSSDDIAFGRVTIRAPRTGTAVSGTGVAISATTNGVLDVVGRSNVFIEGVRSNQTFASTVGGAAALNTIRTDVTAFLANAPAIIAAAPLRADRAIQLRAGVEITDAPASAVSTTSATTLDFGAAPIGLGTLTVRSTGDLVVAGTISDGIASSGVASRESWSYRLVAGADLTAANPNATVVNRSSDTTATSRGKLSVAAGKDIRTGTGSIAASASADIEFRVGTVAAAPGSIYTFGRVAGANDRYVVAPGYFSGLNVARADGGAVTLNAGGDVIGNEMRIPPTGWLLRQGAINPATGAYTLAPGWLGIIDTLATGAAGFNMHAGSLGGGKLNVVGRDIRDLYAASVSMGRVRSTTPSIDALEVRNAAPVTISANRNVLGGQFVGMDAELRITAGDSIARRTVGSSVNQGLMTPVHSNNLVRVNAGGSIVMANPFNATLLLPNTGSPSANFISFSTFGDNSVLNASSAGNITAITNSSSDYAGASPTVNSLLGLTTPNWQIQTSASINIGGQTLAPSYGRRFTLLAGENVFSNASAVLVLSNPGGNALDPVKISHRFPVSGVKLPTALEDNRKLLAVDPLAASPETVLVYAGRDVGPNQSNPDANQNIQLNFDQPVAVRAGRDINQLQLLSLHQNVRDQTTVEAGRDIANTVTRLATRYANNEARIQVEGPGALVVAAGRDIRLGNTDGGGLPAVSTVGNLRNGNLPAGGAHLVLVAGLSSEPAYESVLEYYVRPSASDSSYDMGRYDLLANTALGNAEGGLKGAALWTSLASLPKSQRDQLARDIFFSEIRVGGGPDTARLTQTYLAANQIAQAPAAPSKALIDFVSAKLGTPITAEAAWAAFNRIITDQLIVFVNAKQGAVVDANTVRVEFAKLPQVIQAEFVGAQLLPQLLLTKVIAQTDPLVRNYGRAYEAAARFFPEDGKGNIDMVYNSVRTLQGGSVQLLVPGTVCRNADASTCTTPADFFGDKKVGNVKVGLENPPALLGGTEKLGLFGLGGAPVSVFAGNNIDINQSRIVTGGGGNLLLWSSYGSIDAGRGSKNATSAPEPIVLINDRGDVTVDFSNSIQGSGIRAISFNEKRPAGEVSLFAPRGTVNAGDAGVQGGSINVGASVVLNAENIRFSADPTGSTVSFGATTATPALASAGGTSSAAAAAGQAQSAAGDKTPRKTKIIIVEFEGFGVDCKEQPEDPSCKPKR